MLELIAVCFLAGQMTFAVPEGWRVTQVYSGGQREWSNQITLVYCPPECEDTRRKGFVTLRRSIAVGEKVEAPKDCTLTIEAQEKP